MSSRRTRDVIVIGAGVIGASVALGLARLGYKTLNLDSLPAAGYGSTSSSSAVIRPFYSYIEGCALAHESRHHWLDWGASLGAKDERGHAEYTECGILVLMAEGDDELLRPSVNAMDEVGVPFQRLGPEEIESRLPGISMQSFGPPKLPDDPDFGMASEQALVGGLLVPEAGYVSDPQLATHNLQRAAEALGGEFRFNTEVATINRSNGRVSGIITRAGEVIDSPIVVNVAGPHSSTICALAGVSSDMRISTRAMRHEVAHLAAPANLDFEHQGCVITDGDTGTYLRPDSGNNMLIGTLDPECDARHYVDANDYDIGFTEQWTNQVWRAAQRFPTLGIPNTARGVIGLYDVTEDWIPIYDCSSLAGFYMAIGTSGNQFKNAPVIGTLMAELISACEAGQDHDLDPVAFRLPHLDRVINLSAFSRRRRLHANTSGTVMA